MKTIKFLSALLLTLALVQLQVLAQQQGLFTQYMFNGLAINPAYAGSHESMSITTLVRQQWVGQDGAPNTQTLAVHSPTRNQKVGLGFLLHHDHIGPTHQYNINAVYAYRIPVGQGKLSMGLQAGLVNHSSRYASLYLGPNMQDPAFAQDISIINPNFGAGIYYFSEKFYAGFASPQLLNNRIGETSRLSRHYFINSGYVFDLNSVLKLKPNLLLKMVEGAPLALDLNTNLLIHEVLWVGASYRSFESLSTLLELQMTDQFRVGYSYDFPTASDIGRLRTGSHELMLNYNFTFYKSTFVTPRNF